MLSNVMKTVPIAGRFQSVTFYEDDTIETVRQLIALEVESHPDRMFVEVKATLPADYYSGNPSHWTELFYRLSYDGETVTEDALTQYVEDRGIEFKPRMIPKEEWEQRIDVDALLNSTAEFFEWRILGVPDARSMVLPLPPRDVNLRAASIPIPRPQSLYETFHPYPVSEFRIATLKDETTTPEQVKRTFFPLFRPDTPQFIPESMGASLKKSQEKFGELLDLHAPKHEQAAFVKAKWYIPLVSTRFPAPRARFEQIFYGLTVSKTTPHIAYFTAKTETIRHKFYVEDPTNKVPVLDTSLLRGWIAKTQPQRRKPTLLLYRGKTSTHFDRIAITDTDITVDVRREKSSKADLESLQTDMLKWLESLDAVTAFVDESDLALSRWELSELSLVATYAKEIAEFDMRRFQCLQSIFSVQNDTFRLLRAEQSGGDLSPQLLQAYQILNQDIALQSPEYLAEEMGISVQEAQTLMTEIETLSEDVNFERSLRAYPILKFARKEVLIRFVTNPERTLKYVDLLRYVLTTDDEDKLSDVCPRRLEEVAPRAIVPQQDVNIEEEPEVDVDLLAMLGVEEEPPAAEQGVSSAAPPPRARKLKIQQKSLGTHNYFNTRLKEFDPETFDQSFYPKKCEKRQQVIALTPNDKSRVGPEYDYSSAPESEKLDLTDPDATVICPPYWCMRDEIPLREDQLVAGEDGEQHCPKCNGKIRPNDSADSTEYTVIRRDAVARYPDFMKKESTINKRKVPCCYVQPRSTSETLSKEDEMYIFREDVRSLPGLRFAYLADQLASKLKVKTNYAKTVKKGHLIFGESDVFRIGLGRPSQTLPVLLDDKTVIKRPKDAHDNVIRCSFFRTWKDTTVGDSTVERIVNSIDAAYETGQLSVLQELEYVTSFLKSEVILIDPTSEQVMCGFWSDTLGANSRTIAVLGTDILGVVKRKRSGKTYKTEFVVNLRNDPFGTTTWPHLLDLHKQACSVGVPTFDDAVAEFQRAGKPTYQVILDPFDRIQAVFLPGDVILPILPTTRKPFAGVVVKSGYVDLTDTDLPSAASETAFVKESKHPGFKIVREHRNTSGNVVEYELASGFRVPIRPEAPSAGPIAEVVETIRRSDEATLVNGVPNEDDKTLHAEVSYAAEVYEFLLFTLSKDIQEDENLYRSVENRSDTLYRDLSTWYDKNAFEDTTKSHAIFLSKVRTPCGQFNAKTKAGRELCEAAPLCGVRGKTCNIKVNPVVKKQDLLKRMVKTLRDNDKQRALVLDNRMSPFFSTILYLELPHELITSSV